MSARRRPSAPARPSACASSRRRARFEAERLERLQRRAAAWRQAEELRAFVEAAAASPRGQRPEFAVWRDDALARADALDPLAAETLDLGGRVFEPPPWLRG